MSIDGNGNAATFEFDKLNRTTRTIDAASQSSYRYYDANGNLTRRRNALGKDRMYEFDSANRQTKAIDPLLRCKTTHFNAAGQVTRVEDALSNSTYYYYDVLGRKTRIKNALNNEVDYEFDAAGNLTRTIDAKDNNFARFEYTVTNRRTLEKDALDNTTTFEYDLNGNMTRKTDGNSDTIEYQYDAANPLLLRDYPNGGDDVTLEYDCLGHKTKVYTSSLTFEYEYNLVGRMTQKKDATENLTMTFEYDAGGRRTKMTGPESGETTWEYSLVNHLTRITNPEADVTEFEHDAAGQRTKLKYNSGAYTDYTRDDAGHILTLHNRTSTDATISKFEYEYDVVGNRTEMVLNDSDTTSYQYDDTYQLTKATYPGGAVHDFAYDASGNRTDWDIAAGPSYDYYHDSADQLTNMAVNGTTWNYYYDGNCAMTTATDGTVQWDYYYNYEGRLCGVDKNTSSVLTNTYNPDGTRRTLSNGGTINFLYDGQSVLAEYDSGWANPDITYTRDRRIDELLMMTSWNYAQEPASHTEYYVHRDALGSTRQLTSSDENTVTTYTYDAWGRTTESTIIGDVSCPFRYTGRKWDDAAEMYYYRARYYDQDLGRFLSREGIRRSDEPWITSFVYVANDPVSYGDSLGRFRHAPSTHYRFLSGYKLSTILNNVEDSLAASEACKHYFDCYKPSVLDYDWNHPRVWIKACPWLDDQDDCEHCHSENSPRAFLRLSDDPMAPGQKFIFFCVDNFDDYGSFAGASNSVREVLSHEFWHAYLGQTGEDSDYPFCEHPRCPSCYCRFNDLEDARLNCIDCIECDCEFNVKWDIGLCYAFGPGCFQDCPQPEGAAPCCVDCCFYDPDRRDYPNCHSVKSGDQKHDCTDCCKARYDLCGKFHRHGMPFPYFGPSSCRELCCEGNYRATRDDDHCPADGFRGCYCALLYAGYYGTGGGQCVYRCLDMQSQHSWVAKVWGWDCPKSTHCSRLAGGILH